MARVTFNQADNISLHSLGLSNFFVMTNDLLRRSVSDNWNENVENENLMTVISLTE